MALLTGTLMGAPGSTSEVYTTPFPVAVGTHARDTAGNEYVFVDFTGTVYGRQPVAITTDWTAAAVGTTGRGLLGVVQGGATSDNAGWVQIYGRALVQLGMSGVSPSDAANGPTTLSNSLATVFVLGTSATSPNGIGWVSGAAAAATSTLQYVIRGMTVASDASPGDVSGTTSATSHTGNEIAVFLNYPEIVPTDITS
jgi:hypothetical protein